MRRSVRAESTFFEILFNSYCDLGVGGSGEERSVASRRERSRERVMLADESIVLWLYSRDRLVRSNLLLRGA